MDYWNVDVRNIRSGMMADLSLEEVGAWTRVSSYCVDQENKGLIKGARSWSDVRWMQTTGVPRELIHRCEGLFQWEGDDLRVWEYPVRQEIAYRKKKKTGSKGGVLSGLARRKLAEERKAMALESASHKGKTAEHSFNQNTEVVQTDPPPAFNVREKEIETGRVKEKEEKEQTRTPIQGVPAASLKPAGAAPLSVCSSPSSLISIQTTAPGLPPIEKDSAWLAGFEEFWSNYPRKDARRKAEQAWRNVKGRERPRLADLMLALGRQSTSPAWREQDGRFIPLPATWINGRRWEDAGSSAGAVVSVIPEPLQMTAAASPLPFGVKGTDGLSPLQRALSQAQESSFQGPSTVDGMGESGLAKSWGDQPW